MVCWCILFGLFLSAYVWFGCGDCCVMRGYVVCCGMCGLLEWLFGSLLVFVFDCFCGLGWFCFVCFAIGACISVFCLVVCVSFDVG